MIHTSKETVTVDFHFAICDKLRIAVPVLYHSEKKIKIQESTLIGSNIITLKLNQLQIFQPLTFGRICSDIMKVMVLTSISFVSIICRLTFWVLNVSIAWLPFIQPLLYQSPFRLFLDLNLPILNMSKRLFMIINAVNAQVSRFTRVNPEKYYQQSSNSFEIQLPIEKFLWVHPGETKNQLLDNFYRNLQTLQSSIKFHIGLYFYSNT